MSADQPTVTYREIPGFPGRRVGDDGSIWTCRQRVLPGPGVRGLRWINSENWRRLDLETCDNGYLRLNLGRGGRKLVHALVLEVFVGPRPPGCECRHLDGVRTNNALANLAWGTKVENAQDRRIHGTQMQGSTHVNAKLTETTVTEIRRRFSAGGVRQCDLAKEYGITATTVMRIVKRRSWTHIP